MRALIVDDEPLARRRVRDLLAPFDTITVAGESEDGPSAVRDIAAVRPDLVFLDVQMPGMDGFEVIASIDAPRPRIIFTTAYDQYALRAFEISAVDYLLKPIDEERFAEAVRRARAAMPEAWDERITALLNRLEKRDRFLRRIVVKEPGRVFFIETRDVDWIESAGNYVRVHANHSAHLIRSTMQAIETNLDPRTFVRIHRKAIVNVSKIAELQSRFRGAYAVILRSGEELELSPAYRQPLQAIIGEF